MSNSITVDPVDSSLIQKYAPTILSAAITVFGGLQVLVSTGHSLANILVFAALVITTATTFALPTRWKLILEVVGVIVSAVLPFAIAHQVTWASALLIAVAVVKALAAAFGVVLRADSSVAPGARAINTFTFHAEPQTTVGHVDEQVGNAEPEPEPEPEPAAPRPAKSANRQVWVDYAVGLGLSVSDSETKASIIARADSLR